MLAIGNPKGHEYLIRDNIDVCLDNLSFASILLRKFHCCHGRTVTEKGFSSVYITVTESSVTAKKKVNLHILANKPYFKGCHLPFRDSDSTI